MTPPRRSSTGEVGAARVPVMLSEADIESLVHSIRGVAPMERPSPNTLAKLRTALRRVDPHRDSPAWDELAEL